MRINIDNILKKPYTKILIANEDQSYSAEILEFPGCYAQGETANEAIESGRYLPPATRFFCFPKNPVNES